MPDPNDCPLDELDISILKHLTADGRKRFTEIAQERGVSHKTIRNRYSRMRELHSLTIIGWLDPQRLGFHGGAQIKFSIEPRHLEKATATIATFPEVTWLGLVMGSFNLMADVWCRDIQHLDDFVAHRLRRVAGVTHMEIALYTRIHKVVTLPSLELLNCAPADISQPEKPGVLGSRAAAGDRLAARPRSTTHESTLDELDIAILEHLSTRGRKPFTEIGQALGVSHGTVRNRYNRMLDINALKVTCWLDPETVGFNALAHLDFSIEIPHLKDAAMEIATFPEITWLAEVMGQPSLMADVFCVDMENLDDLVSRRLGQVAGMRHMEVALYSQVRKITTMPNLELLNRAVRGV